MFTYALMEALHRGDTNGNGKIEVSELAAHIEKRVPELFAELKQSGWVVKGLSVAPVRGVRRGRQARPRISARREGFRTRRAAALGCRPTNIISAASLARWTGFAGKSCNATTGDSRAAWGQVHANCRPADAVSGLRSRTGYRLGVQPLKPPQPGIDPSRPNVPGTKRQMLTTTSIKEAFPFAYGGDYA